MYERHIVIDLEFTPIPRQFEQEREIVRSEIIQIGAVMLDETYRRIDTFSTYVRPQLAEHISPKVSQLTGITDEDVKDAPVLEQAMEEMAAWIGDRRTRIYSWSNSDRYQIEDECWLKEIDVPETMYRWINFQRLFCRLLGCKQQISLKHAVGSVEWEFSAKEAHSALYDAILTSELLQLAVNRELFLERTAVIRSTLAPPKRGSTLADLIKIKGK